MKWLHKLRMTYLLVRDAELMYSCDYERKCSVRLPGVLDGPTIMQAGDRLRVYVIRRKTPVLLNPVGKQTYIH